LELESSCASSESFLTIVFHYDYLKFGGDTTGKYFLMGILYDTFLDYTSFNSAFGTKVLKREIARDN
jgi:dsRNA-specific ribonuclease